MLSTRLRSAHGPHHRNVAQQPHQLLNIVTHQTHTLSITGMNNVEENETGYDVNRDL